MHVAGLDAIGALHIAAYLDLADGEGCPEVGLVEIVKDVGPDRVGVVEQEARRRARGEASVSVEAAARLAAVDENRGALHMLCSGSVAEEQDGENGARMMHRGTVWAAPALRIVVPNEKNAFQNHDSSPTPRTGHGHEPGRRSHVNTTGGRRRPVHLHALPPVSIDMAALCRWLVVLLAAACCHALHNESSLGAAGGELGGGGGFGRLAGPEVGLAPTWAEAAANVGAFQGLVGGVAGCAAICVGEDTPAQCVDACTNMLTSSTKLGPYSNAGTCYHFCVRMTTI